MPRYLLALLLTPSVLAAQTEIKSLHLERGQNTVHLAGQDSWFQLLVVGKTSQGKETDQTRAVSYRVHPPDIVKIDETGLATPIREGEAVLEIQAPGLAPISTKIQVTHLTQDLPVHFVNQVVPIFTRFSCNAGGCHGKAGGQNGFQLSLLGFEPQEDYEYLVKEARGRRLFPAAPESSLLLLKAAGGMPHGGGKKIEPDSSYYSVLRRWVAQGMPYGSASDPVVTHIQVLPGERTLAPASEQQLAVIAHLSDGSQLDVTRLSQFEVNDASMAEVGPTGLVMVKRQPGSVAVMARYQTHVGVFRATVPQGLAVGQAPAGGNFIDDLVFAQLKHLGIPASAPAEAGTFLRRATIDIAGRLPTLEETKAYLADTAGDKEEKLIDRLLASEDYAFYFANKWNAILRNRRSNPGDDPKPNLAFHAWIKDSLHQNKPFDRFVRELLTVTGEEILNPPVVWYRELRESTAQMEDVAQLFLGQRLACAKCHHHPMEKWSQHDYWSLAAFFSRVEVKEGIFDKKKKAKDPTVVFHKPGVPQAQHPRTKQNLKPAGLASAPVELDKEEDPRGKLADWMTAPENPFFARTLVNRYWKHFFGRGLVDPEDDMRVTNPPTNPALLDALANSFTASKYDLKKLVRTIALSRTYRLSAVPSEHNASDRQNFSHFYLRRIHAEVLFDAIDAVTGSKTAFKGLPGDTKAIHLPDNQFDSYFLSVFGRPDSSSPCECERGSDSNLAQALYLFNSEELLEKICGKKPAAPIDPMNKNAPKKNLAPTGATLVSAGGRIQQLLKDQRPAAEKVRDLYLLALSREPRPDELRANLAYLEQRKDRTAEGYEDILWALINTKEFLFNH